MYTKMKNRIANLPILMVASYLFFSIFVFLISPMFPFADSGFLAIAYGIVAISCFCGGYLYYVRRVIDRDVQIELGTSKLDALIIIMSLQVIIYYIPQIRLAVSYYGLNLIEFFADIGQNYLNKDDFIDELSQAALGPFYTLVNILSFTQVAIFVIAPFRWNSISIFSKLAYVSAALIVVFFYITIGTMSGIFYVLMLSLCGWLASRQLDSLSSLEKIEVSSKKIAKMLFWTVISVLLFFVFMVYALSSRATRITVELPGFYDKQSLVYRILGQEYGDGFSLALAYVGHGWYGLNNSLDLDFVWTYGLSSSRAIADYYYRFAGIENPTIPLSYPVRQENFTGYPAFAYWHTIFPWLASDVTFPGALILTILFGIAYAKVWLAAIREGCLISATLFGLMSIGAFFMNANSQILDSKTLTLALFALCLMYPFRRSINRWILHDGPSAQPAMARLNNPVQWK